MKINFLEIQKRCSKTAKLIRKERQSLINILTRYETKFVAADEIIRVLDLLENISENSKYFQGQKIKDVAVFLPSNQPLYSFFCFAVIPSFQSAKVKVRLPDNMASFFEDLMVAINLEKDFTNIEVLRLVRSKFLAKITQTRIDKVSNEDQPITDVVIFTGRAQNSIKVKKLFSKKTLFIFNGYGHNPVLVTDSANIQEAVMATIQLQLYNQGQDCAAPNSILISSEVFPTFMKKLHMELRKVKVGAYTEKGVTVGPITRKENLISIGKFLIKNNKWIDKQTGAHIDFKTHTIRPVIINKDLKYGGNYVESFAPIFIIQKYSAEVDLGLYFDNEHYRKNAMYVTVFGSSEFLNSKKNDLSFPSKYGILINDTHLHANGVERGINEYGGYSKNSSSLSLNGITVPTPTLPQRDIYNILIRKDMEKFQTMGKGKKEKIKSQQENPENRIHWASNYTDEVLDRFPDRDEYVCAAGISPSGMVHFGNLRDIVAPYAVFKELGKRGKKSKMIFSWDDFDRFRKVPQDIDSSFEKYVGMPLSEVPSPDGTDKSYAKYHEENFEHAMKDLDMEIEYRYQTDEYKSGRYDEYIIEALKKRNKIAEILLSFMTEKGKKSKSIRDSEYIEGYYPITVYSRFSGKDNTVVIDYDGDKKITYKCFDTGKTETIDITKDRVVKLSWKIDWPMRWGVEDVSFEPGGKDHSTPGGSYDTSSVIATEVFGVEPPVYQAYDFVGIRGVGDKMSGSKGNSISPEQLLGIYSPELLKWLYFKTDPNKTFSLAFDSEVYRQYDEFDTQIEKMNKESEQLSNFEVSALEISGVLKKDDYKKPISFRQAVGLGQVVQWNREKMIKILDEQGESYDKESIENRLERAKIWLETYNSKDIIKLEDKKNLGYIETLSKEELEKVRELRAELVTNPHRTIAELNGLVYGIVQKENLDKKENAKRQRLFFKTIYNLLIGRNSGPRLSTFLWALENKDKINQLLDV